MYDLRVKLYKVFHSGRLDIPDQGESVRLEKNALAYHSKEEFSQNKGFVKLGAD
jgi:hypothetical protein